MELLPMVFFRFFYDLETNPKPSKDSLTGGSVHPGGGIPLVLQSAFNVQKLMKQARQ